MVKLSNYETTQKLHETNRSLIIRGRRVSDGLPVIIKTPLITARAETELRRLQREYEIGRLMENKHIIQYYAIEPYQQGLALVMEDYHAVDMSKTMMSDGFSIPKFLDIAIQLITGLEHIHDKGVIHRDIKPGNILINRETGIVKFIDFSASSRMQQDSRSLSGLERFDGTLAYMSPEQTGKMNRVVDFRTDFYSLGVTFYEFLTGRRPFPMRDSLELVHAHLARHPVQPHELKEGTPTVLSEIILKLMAKNAEERYQSCKGLRLDLEKCRQDWERHKHIVNFAIGQSDFLSKFRIPQKLYGRDAEIKVMMDSFAHVVTGGTEILLINGPAGMGKSQLINEIRKPVTIKKGYFISGKFDLLNRNLPYSAIIQAFQGLIRQILGESEKQIRVWRHKLLEALGQKGRIIVDLIPELEFLIGRQPDPAELEQSGSRVRFHSVFLAFLNVFANKNHPLVLFIDDLQWGDTASFHLLWKVLRAEGSGGLLFIGSFREQDPRAKRPFKMILEEIKKSNVSMQKLDLGPLEIEHITNLVLDMFHCDQDSAFSLAEILKEKTNGNPFFLNTLLNDLHREGHIHFSTEKGGWQWDEEALRKVRVSDNVVSFVIERLQQLPEETREALVYAACIGNHCNDDFLAKLMEKSRDELAGALWEAVDQGVLSSWIVEAKGRRDSDLLTFYQFQHDRLHHAAYRLADKPRRTMLHLEIARKMTHIWSGSNQEDKAIDIAHHYHLGASMLEDPEEKTWVIAYHLKAGAKARAANAYRTAMGYFEGAVNLLAEDAWVRQPELAYEVHFEFADSAFLCGERESAGEHVALLLKHAGRKEKKARVLHMCLVHCAHSSQHDKAVSSGIQALAFLGIKLREKPGRLMLLKELLRVKLQLRGKSAGDILRLPSLTDERLLLVMRILTALSTPTLSRNLKRLHFLTVLKRVSLSLKHGNCASSAHAYIGYGLLRNMLSGDLNDNQKFGLLGLDVDKRFNDLSLRSRNLFTVGFFIQPWNIHWRLLSDYFKEGIKIGKEIGDQIAVSYNVSQLYIWDPSMDLETSAHHIKKALVIVERSNYEEIRYLCQLELKLRLNFLGHLSNRFSLADEDFDERACLAFFEEKNFQQGVFAFYLTKAKIHVMYEDYTGALSCLEQIRNQAGKIPGYPYKAEYFFLTFLVHAQLHDDLSGLPRLRSMRQMKGAYERMKRWSDHCPTNFLHLTKLMAAEFARLERNVPIAMSHYDQAIEVARQRGYLHHEALANELAARFYAAMGREKTAATYMKDAYFVYFKWGAYSKVRHLEKNCPYLQPGEDALHFGLTDHAGASNRSVDELKRSKVRDVKHDPVVSSFPYSGSPGDDSLDLATVIKASQAISSEINLGGMLANTMRVIIENAGAQRGFLIIQSGDQLKLEATAVADPEMVEVLQGQLLQSSRELAVPVVNYVCRTGENVVLKNASEEGLFTKTPYIRDNQSKSILCIPIRHKDRILGALYLENNLTADAFTSGRVELLHMLLAQAAISLENARLYTESKNAEAEVRKLNEELEARVTKRTKELEKAQEELVDKAHQAGMAEIATAVLHNVGNILNSVNTSSQLICDGITTSRLRNIGKANTLLRDHTGRLGEFLEEDPKGKKLLTYYLSLDKIVGGEFSNILDHAVNMQAKVDSIRDIIIAQQDYASRGFHSEPVILGNVVEDALRIQDSVLSRNEIVIVKRYDPLLKVYAQKTKLIHVIINLLKNSREAMNEIVGREKRIIISTRLDDQYGYLVVKDNGPGIVRENREKVFAFGFTTKEDGHGFGLHGSATAMLEMGGSIWIEDSGDQGGTTFVMRLPLREPKNTSQTSTHASSNR